MDYEPGSDHLRALHDELRVRVRERGIRIVAVAGREWCQRYTFARDRDRVAFDFWHNGKGTVTRSLPVNPMRGAARAPVRGHGTPGGGGGMSTSREVFALRREGRHDEALAIARERMAAPGRDDWDMRAFAWVRVDLIKTKVRAGDRKAAAGLAGELRALEPPDGDEILTKQRLHALSLLEEGADELAQARERSKAGRFREAVAIYERLAGRELLGPESGKNHGWDLFRAAQERLGRTPPEGLRSNVVVEAKRYLKTYIALGLDRPSRLHGCMLRLAARLASGGHPKMLPFARLWGLEHLQPEDFEPFVADDGKSFPPLAEKVVGKAAKEAAESGRGDDCAHVLPFVEGLMRRFPANPWPALNKVKLLRALGRLEESRELALSFARTKAREYWAWELLGDLQDAHAERLACYGKALTCSQEDSFVSPLRLKLARGLLAAGRAAEARGEAEHVIEHKRRAGRRVPAEAQEMAESDWYAATPAVPPKPAAYARLAAAADELLFAHLPWIDACPGEAFTVEGRDGKPRRRLYLRASPLPLEVAVPSSRIRLRAPRPGQPVRVKADHHPDGGGRFVLHALTERPDGEPFDILPEAVGAIHAVNAGKDVIRFTAGRDLQGSIPVAGYGGEARVGAPLSLRLAAYRSHKGGGVRAVTAEPTDQAPDLLVCRPFRSAIRVTRKGLGFTDDGVFVPPGLVAAGEVGDQDVVTGLAVPSFDSKKGGWGRKAILLSASARPDQDRGLDCAALRPV